MRTQLGDPVNISFDLKQSAGNSRPRKRPWRPVTATPEQERGMSKEQKEALEKQTQRKRRHHGQEQSSERHV